MYDIKSIEAGNNTNQKKEFVTSTFYENLNNNYKQRHSNTNNDNTINYNNNNNNNKEDINCNSISSQVPENNTMFLTFRRRRIFNRQACLISIMAAFIFGLSLGVFLPMVSMTASAFTTELNPSQLPQTISISSSSSSSSNSNKYNDNNSNIRIKLHNGGDNIDNIIPEYLKIGTSISSVAILNNITLQANKTSLYNNSKSMHNSNNDDFNSRQYNSFIPEHPASDFPTIYELKQQQEQEQEEERKKLQKIDSKNQNEYRQDIFLNLDNIPLQQPSINFKNIPSNSNKFSVTFVKEKKLPVEEIFRNAFHLEQDKLPIDSLIVKKLNDVKDGSSIKKILHENLQHTGVLTSSSIEEILLNNDDIDYRNIDHSNGKADKVNLLENKRINNGIGGIDAHIKLDQIQEEKQLNLDDSVNFFTTVKSRNSINKQSHSLNGNNDQKPEHRQYERHNFIKNDIYWGDLVENSIPKGYNNDDIDNWNYYIQNVGVVKTLENGCGRMQNRLIIFNDGKRACARYRQNTDQIQGELFSFYLGQLLNLTNLAPSAASVIDFKIDTWSSAQQDLQDAQWKQTRPVVLTKWLPNLESAGIPISFQPLERHLNKYDVWNITLSIIMEQQQKNFNNQKEQEKEEKEMKINFEKEYEKEIKNFQIQKNEQENDHQHDRKLVVVQQNKNHENLNKYHYTQSIQQQQKEQQSDDLYQHNIQEDKKGLLERLGANRFNNNNQSYKKSADSISIDIASKKDRNTKIESLINHSGNINDNENRKSNNDNNISINNNSLHIKNQTLSSKVIYRLIELAQWSDLIIFDYLIANLDRVVNNLYNYQWNADIMAAPAHNLARQIDSQLLIFLDNESGLLHGYRLLKKYETYHNILLDNLCVFREPTIIALKRIKEFGPGQLLQDIFEQSTSHQLRDVLPSLPDKSIKILIDRIDRVLGQVEKCQNQFGNR